MNFHKCEKENRKEKEWKMSLLAPTPTLSPHARKKSNVLLFLEWTHLPIIHFAWDKISRFVISLWNVIRSIMFRKFDKEKEISYLSAVLLYSDVSKMLKIDSLSHTNCFSLSSRYLSSVNRFIDRILSFLSLI